MARGDAPDAGPAGTLPPRWDGLLPWRHHSAIKPHKKRFRRTPGRIPFRSQPRLPRAFAFVSPDTNATAHGATIAYLKDGFTYARPDWDFMEWAAAELLGYAWRRHMDGCNALRDALQTVALTWPPLDFRTALHQVIWLWSTDPRTNDQNTYRTNTRRLHRARAILQQWNPPRAP